MISAIKEKTGKDNIVFVLNGMVIQPDKYTTLELKENGEKVTWLTSYDFPTAQFAEAAGLDMILVGDSLGMCVYGYKGTVPVTMDQCIVHCDAVRRGAPNTFIVGDMPFMSYQTSDVDAVYNAGRFLAMQFFPWLIVQAKQAIDKKELMPGHIIRVRNMAEQVEDNGDIMATALAMQVICATYVESLDTRGTDGSNVHLGGPGTITGYYAGIGQPNDYPIKWAEEYLYYYTTYGIKQVLNINPGTILLGYMMHRMGVDIEFKISVFVGNDNPYFIMWTLFPLHSTTCRICLFFPFGPKR